MWPDVVGSPLWPHSVRILAVCLVFSLLTIGAASAQQVALEAILQEANDLKDGDACDGAVPLYTEVVDRVSPDSPLRAYALYNRAVCFEELGSPELSTASYDLLIEDATLPDLAVDARFRRGLLVVVHGGDTAAARRDFQSIRQRATGIDRALVDLQLARLDLAAGRPRAAARRVARASESIEGARGTDVDRRGTALDWYAGEARLTQGDIWLQAAEAVSLALKGPIRVTKRITRRAEYLANAERFYVATIEAGKAPWSQQALLQLGRGYVSAADALAQLFVEAGTPSPGPPSRTARAALERWLEPRIDAQLRKAADAWVLCLQVQTEIGGAPLQAQACQQGVDELVDRLTPEEP